MWDSVFGKVKHPLLGQTVLLGKALGSFQARSYALVFLSDPGLKGSVVDVV